ncbi:MAG TPA: class I SAM-dependent methyltransferase [Bacteroidia bacterium]|nr:class I SAM-dependent methyltransferase [Bacteroidia bacterium]
MKDFERKLNKLLDIYNIPLQENWEEWIAPDKYTVYKYWLNNGLINKDEFNAIYPSKKVQLNNAIAAFFKTIDYHYKPNYYINGSVADVGSGFGYITFWLILSGAKHVITIGDPVRIGFIQKLYDRAIELNLIDAGKISFKPEFIKVGDTTLSKDIAKGSLSLVLLCDTLEHITPRIFTSLVKSVYNDLKPGGFFISWAQNSDSPSMLEKLKVIWEKTEKNTYINQRLKIIQYRIPNISEVDANNLAVNTRGLDSVDFYGAIKNYEEGKVIPHFNPNLPAIDVEYDIPEEGDTSIERICSEFRKNNFTMIKVYPEMRNSRRSRYFQPLAKFIPKPFLKLHIFDESTVFFISK